MAKISRSAVMKDAHRLRRQMRALGENWDFGRCLRYSWRKHKGKAALRNSCQAGLKFAA